jgi:hypothetical protein
MKLLMVLLILLQGCSYVEYKGNPDGSTNAYAYTFGSENALSGFKASISPTGERKISIKELSSDHVEGIKEINQGLSLIIQGAAKAAK